MIDPERWYSVDAVAARWNVGRDTVIRRIKVGLLLAMEIADSPRRKRTYKIRRVQGAEIARFERENMTA